MAELPVDVSQPPAQGNLFWAFSQAFYRLPDVAAACLALQDHRQVDVNLLLYCLWRGQRGETLTGDDLARLLPAVADWQHQVVRPLRTARRWLKTQSLLPEEREGGLRQALKQQELAAEKREQDILFACLPLPLADPARYPQGRQAAKTNCRAYLSILAAPASAQVARAGPDAAALALLLDRLFPDQR